MNKILVFLYTEDEKCCCQTLSTFGDVRHLYLLQKSPHFLVECSPFINPIHYNNFSAITSVERTLRAQGELPFLTDRITNCILIYIKGLNPH